MNSLFGVILTTVFLLGIAATGAGRDCNKYSSYHRLPDKFQEIASGELSGLPHSELFVMSDGICTCANVSDSNCTKDQTHVRKNVWSCRQATDDERPSEQNSKGTSSH
jgi:hypothetical protein